MAKKNSDLSPRQQLFIREYQIDKNGTKAAIRAGYSEKGAAVTAHELLRNPKISQELTKLEEKLHSKLEISAERVLQGLAELAFFDPGQMYNPDGSFKKISEMDEATRRCVAGVEIEKLYKHFGKGQAEEVGQVTKIKHWDRGMNLERLGKHFKLFTDRVEHEVSESMAEIIRGVRQRKSEYERGRK